MSIPVTRTPSSHDSTSHEAKPPQAGVATRVSRCVCQCLCCLPKIYDTARSTVYRTEDTEGRPRVIKKYHGPERLPFPNLAPLRSTFYSGENHCLFPRREETNRGGIRWTAPFLQATDTPYDGLTDVEPVLFEKPFRADHPYTDHPERNVIRIVLNLLLGPIEVYKKAQEEKLFEYGIGDLKPPQYLLTSKTKEGVDPYVRLVLTDLSEQVPPRQYTPGYYPEIGPDNQPTPGGFFHATDLFALMVIFSQMLGQTLSGELEFDTEAISNTKIPVSDAFYLSGNDEITYSPAFLRPPQYDFMYDEVKQLIQESNLLGKTHKQIAQCLLECIDIAYDGYEKAYKEKEDVQAAQATVLTTLEQMQALIKTNYLPNSGDTGSPNPSRSSSPTPSEAKVTHISEAKEF